MNLPSEPNGALQAAQTAPPRSQPPGAFLAPETRVTPFEFRALTDEDREAFGLALESRGTQQAGNGQAPRSPGTGNVPASRTAVPCQDRAQREAIHRSAIEAARREGFEHGAQEGRRAAGSDMQAEMQQSLAQERARLLSAVEQFRGVRERYFAEVEQEVVKLALAIAARILHREVQIDPLLLTGVVRVALEKMADRSEVVLRVASADVAAWERVFHATEASERPRVAEDAQLQNGECVLESKMGTVELGVAIQLEEIEKGFFDLLNHRPEA